jgi:hypothetical protein
MLLVLFLLMCLSNLTSSIDKLVWNYKKQKTQKNTTLSIQDVIKNYFKEGYLTPIFDNLKTAQNYFNYFNKDGSNVLVAFDVKKIIELSKIGLLLILVKNYTTLLN